MTPRASPAGLRIIHAVVFLGFASSTLAAVWPEFAHLFHALGLPYHHGDPPNAIAIASGTLAAAGIIVIVANLFRGRSTPLAMSAVVLLGFGGALVRMFADAPKYRSWQSADAAILGTAQELAGNMIEGLQKSGAAPKDAAVWQRALDALDSSKAVAVRNRSFAPVPMKVQLVAAKGAVPADAAPGNVLVWVSDDAVTFELTPVGFDEHDAPAALHDDKGEPLVFKGAFNSDLAGKR